ncbi:MAG: hypothetical protein JRJ69_06610 [Deltaproteobacteria bacterium]|nr:hypothetical protein [Deltaproteobacteria bacterium]
MLQPPYIEYERNAALADLLELLEGWHLNVYQIHNGHVGDLANSLCSEERGL